MASRNDYSQNRQLYVGTVAEVTVADGNAIIADKVGIGTTGPDSPLEVEFTEATGTAKQMMHIDYNSTNNYGSGYLKISAGGSSQALTFIEQVTSGGNGLFGTYIDTNIINKGLSASAHGNINFVTGSSTSASSIVMTIGGGSQKGNVGIGDTTPSFPLVVSKSSSNTTNSGDGSMRLSLINPDQTNNNYALIALSDGTSQPGSGFMGMQFTDHTNNYGELVFGTRGAVGYGERMRIDSEGNVGIGETNPQAKLDIYDTFTKTAANPNTVEVFHTGSVSTNNIYPVAGLFTQRVSGSANVFATGLVGVAEKLGDYGYLAKGVQGIGKLSGNITINNADMEYMGVEGRIEMEGSNSVNLDDRAYSFYGTAEIDSGSHLKEYHGLYLKAPTNNGTILNKYGVSQVDSNSRNYFAGNVGIGTITPTAKLDVTNGEGKFCVDSKTHGLTNAFTTCLTVNLNSHTGCYVTLTCFGDWGSHSSAAYRGEFFLQNGANGYAEPGIILRQDDNTSVGTDQITCQILDPTSGANPKDFEIQIRTTATTGTTSFTGQLTYTVQGKFNSIT